jgi:GDP/UDP-N,N'-diacetylbacillosamine 2-epimerase (hydrolysing)
LAKRNLLITFHPVTLEKSTAESQFQKLLNVLSELKDTHLIFTKPNADTDGRIIIQMIDDYVATHPDSSIAFTSLGQKRYLSAMQYIDGVVGNSSSGLIEAPSFRIGTINIGDRQRGRVSANSVIDCEPTTQSIREAIKILYTDSFQEILKKVQNPYGTGGASEKILQKLRSLPLTDILKKHFYDFEFK